MATGVWRLYAAAGALLAVAFFLFPDGGSAQAAIYGGVAFTAAASITISVRVYRPQHALPWMVLATGILFSSVANVLWFRGPLFPSVVDALYIVSYLLYAIALLMFVRARERQRDRAGLLDSLAVTMGAAVGFWVFIMEPYAEDSGLPLLSRAVSLSYPLMDLLLISLLVRLLFTPAKKDGALWLLGAGFLFQLAADTGYAITLLNGTFYLGHPLSAIYLLSVVMLGAAALEPSMTRLTQSPRDSEAPSTKWRVLLLGEAALIPPAVLIVEALRGETDDVVVFSGLAAALFVIVLARVAGLMSDLKERRNIEAALRDAEHRYRSLVENIPVVVYIDAVDELATTQYIAPTIESLTGFTAQEWQATPGMWLERMHPDDKDRVLALHEETNRTGEAFVAEYRLFHRDGSVVWVRDESLVVVPDEAGTPLYWQGVLVDIGERKRADEQRDRFEQELRHLALHDPLTGLPNRALFTDRLQHALDRLSGRGRRDGPAAPLAVLFLDLDEFKSVNDTLGHTAGDELLVQVAERLGTSVRPSDSIARLGGDEFAILLEELTSDADARRVAERVLDGLKEPFLVGGRERFASASIGVAADDSMEWRAEDFLRSADVAMYSAKARGKATFSLFEPGMQAALLRRVELESDLRSAIENQELILHYQPIVSLGTAQISGVEALVRWQHPRRGLIPPNEFIPIAENSGAILPLGRWVLLEACRQVRAWQLQFENLAGLKASVNLSPKRLHPGLADEVAEALRESGLAPGCLILEITEGVLMERAEETVSRLQDLKSVGVLLAIDDFGTGYSSLAYLRRFPIDILKIDKSFIDGVASGVEEAALARAIVKLGHNLNLQTVAEGIERPEQLDELCRLGSHMGQGFLLARPAPPAQVEAILARPPASPARLAGSA